MLAIERRNKILEILQKDGRVVVSDLGLLFKVTEETIRRDLEKLEKDGLAKKTYGGAILVDNLSIDLPYTVRMKTNVDSKEAIARKVSDLIDDGDHLMLDASSTAIFVAKHLKYKRNLTVITNSIEILLELSGVPGCKVLSTGGVLKEGSLSLIGYQAEKMINSFHVNKTIISAKGLDLKKGITDSNESEVHIKKLMLEAANTKILIADSSKFDRISFTKICDYNEIDMLVTDSALDERWSEVLDKNNVEYKHEYIF